MTKDEARIEALRRWRALPQEERRTHAQAEIFAAALAEQLGFRTMGNERRVIAAWLIRDMDGLAEAPTPGEEDSPARQARRAADPA